MQSCRNDLVVRNLPHHISPVVKGKNLLRDLLLLVPSQIFDASHQYCTDKFSKPHLTLQILTRIPHTLNCQNVKMQNMLPGANDRTWYGLLWRGNFINGRAACNRSWWPALDLRLSFSLVSRLLSLVTIEYSDSFHCLYSRRVILPSGNLLYGFLVLANLNIYSSGGVFVLDHCYNKFIWVFNGFWVNQHLNLCASDCKDYVLIRS